MWKSEGSAKRKQRGAKKVKGRRKEKLRLENEEARNVEIKLWKSQSCGNWKREKQESGD